MAKKPSKDPLYDLEKPVAECSAPDSIQVAELVEDSLNSTAIEPTENSDTKKHDLEHLKPYQFQPGQSGNPGGKQKTKPMAEALQKELDTVVKGKNATKRQLIARKLANMAIAGNIEAIKVVYDRMDGKAISDDLDKSVQILIVNKVPTAVTPVLADSTSGTQPDE